MSIHSMAYSDKLSTHHFLEPGNLLMECKSVTIKSMVYSDKFSTYHFLEPGNLLIGFLFVSIEKDL